jgi:hypothetical protein
MGKAVLSNHQDTWHNKLVYAGIYVHSKETLIFTHPEAVLHELEETDCTTAVWFCY